jgi:hypothetical protein
MIGNIGDSEAIDKYVVSIPQIPHGRFEKMSVNHRGCFVEVCRTGNRIYPLDVWCVE